MIMLLTGRLLACHPGFVLLSVSGVGYQVVMTDRMITTISKSAESEDMTLYIYHAFRDTGQTLYGFLTQRQRDLFIKLIAVSGVGSRIGLSVLDQMSLSDLSQAIYTKNIAQLTTISGVGKKMAERMIIELADKLEPNPDSSHTAINSTRASAQTDPDLMLALQSLGYKPNEIRHMLQQAHFDPNSSLSDKIAQLLKKV